MYKDIKNDCTVSVNLFFKCVSAIWQCGWLKDLFISDSTQVKCNYSDILNEYFF